MSGEGRPDGGDTGKNETPPEMEEPNEDAEGFLTAGEEEEESGAGEGAAVEEEVAKFEGDVEARGRQLRWARKGIADGREK